jgi:5-formyltetrahydrofolate cyclo-ligase
VTAETLEERKKRTRRAVALLVETLTAPRLAEESAMVCRQLADLPEVRQARVLMAYAPTDREVDCREACRAALAGGRVVLLPAIDWDAKVLIPRRVTSVDSGLVVRKHGIPEPVAAPNEIGASELSEIDVVFVPGIAFDEAGRRLGRGGGFYDRFLSRIPARTRRIGLALEVQGLREVPAGEQDARVDAVVLPSRVWRCPPRDGSGLAR